MEIPPSKQDLGWFLHSVLQWETLLVCFGFGFRFGIFFFLWKGRFFPLYLSVLQKLEVFTGRFKSSLYRGFLPLSLFFKCLSLCICYDFSCLELGQFARSQEGKTKRKAAVSQSGDDASDSFDFSCQESEKMNIGPQMLWLACFTSIIQISGSLALWILELSLLFSISSCI